MSKEKYSRTGSCMMLLQRRGRSDSTGFREKKSCQHVVFVMYEDCTTTVERWRIKQQWLSQNHFVVATVHSLKYDLSALAATAQWCLSLSLALYPPGAPVSSDVGMDKHVSSAGSDFQPWDPGIFLPSFPLNTSWTNRPRPLPRPQPIPSVGPEGETFLHPGKEESHLQEFWE